MLSFLIKNMINLVKNIVGIETLLFSLDLTFKFAADLKKTVGLYLKVEI